jgi:hypothetical protein
VRRQVGTGFGRVRAKPSRPAQASAKRGSVRLRLPLTKRVPTRICTGTKPRRAGLTGVREIVGSSVQPGLERLSPRTHLRRIEPLAMLAQDLEQAYLNATFDHLPKGAACSPSSEARVRTSIPTSSLRKKETGIVTASGTLTLREAACEEPIQGRQRRWRH